MHDPVSAISEAEATGEVAVLFVDIRETMQLPLLTSIWRTLAGVEGGVPAVWEAVKPLFETGQPAAALLRLRAQATLCAVRGWSPAWSPSATASHTGS